MDRRTIVFGTELRRRRMRAELSLADLAGLVHYSKSHLSKVENGVKPASLDLARRCDAALSCDGALARLAPRPAVDAPTQIRTDVDEVWVLSMEAGGSNEFHSLSRRSLLTGGVAGAAAWATFADASGPGRPEVVTGGDGSVLAAYRTIFDELRGLGQRLPPALLIPMLVTQTHSLRSLAARAAPAQRRALLLLAARFAEYTGWMAQEAGDDARAAWWTGCAVEMAAAGGDREMAAYALVRRALITLYQQDAVQTVALAHLAQSLTADARIRSLALQREAQGHALAGDYSSCLRALDRAGSATAGAAGGMDGPVLGTTHVTDPLATATGWCLFDLGRPAEAAEVLARECDRIPVIADRARSRFGARLALALAGSGEPEQACVELSPVLDACARIDSATIRTDLRHLNRALSRWHGVPVVRETRLRLGQALHRAVPDPS